MNVVVFFSNLVLGRSPKKGDVDTFNEDGWMDGLSSFGEPRRF
jgi:hypothetical protein